MCVCVSSDGLGTSSECIPAGLDSSTLTTLISRNMMDADAQHMRFTVATVSPSASVCSRIVLKKNPLSHAFISRPPLTAVVERAVFPGWIHYIKHTHAGTRRSSDSHF